MRIRWLVLGGALMLLAGCGSSGKSATTHSTVTSAPPTSPASAAAPRTGLATRVLTNDELPGFTASQAPTVEHDPRRYLVGGNDTGAQLTADLARLKQLGFKAAVSENLSAPGQDGLSVVEQLGSARAARSEVTSGVRGAKGLGGTFGTFPVSGIPGAIGYSLSSAQGDGINITWAVGPYYYLVGETLSSLQKSSENTLNIAALHLYRRTRG
jgi:hypothetical protein